MLLQNALFLLEYPTNKISLSLKKSLLIFSIIMHPLSKFIYPTIYTAQPAKMFHYFYHFITLFLKCHTLIAKCFRISRIMRPSVRRCEIRDARYGDVWVLLKGQRSFALLRMTYMIVYSYNVNIIFAVSFRVTRTWTHKEYPSFPRISNLVSRIFSNISTYITTKNDFFSV